MLVKLLVFCVLFSLVFCGNTADCCNVDHDPNAGDEAWFVYAPPDISIQCHLALLNGDYDANIDPNYTGWGWEINGCKFRTDISQICTADSGSWCDDGNGGGTNDVLDDYDDSFTSGCGLTRVYTRTWNSQTSCSVGGILSADQTINLVDTIGPTLAVPADLEIECPPALPNLNSLSELDNLFGSPDVIDFCQPLVATSISQGTTVVDATTGTFDRTFFVSDGCQDSTGVQHITFADTTPPVLQRLPNIYAECDAIPLTIFPAAQDTCYRTDTNIIVDFIVPDVTYEGICAGKYSFVRTWFATDPALNTAYETQTIVVDDTTPPVITPPPVSTVNIYNVPCFSDITFPYTQVDACSNTESAAVPYDISLSHNEDEGRTEVLVEYTSSDLCGNSEQWADLWQVNSGIGVFSDVISGPTSLVDKGTTFQIVIDITATNGCIPFGILLVDSGVATLQSGSDTCFFQAATGVIYCDPVPTSSPYSLVLNLQVPADYLGDNVLISISWHFNYRTIAVILGSYLVSFNP